MKRVLGLVAVVVMLAGCQGTKSISAPASSVAPIPAATSPAPAAPSPTAAPTTADAGRASLAAAASAAEAKFSSLLAKLSTAPPSASASAAATGLKVFKPGYVATVTDSGAPILRVGLTLKGFSQKPADQYSGKPKNGYFLTITVAAKATKGGQDVNPFDFYAKAPDGTHYNEGDGNSLFAIGDSGLHDTTLNAGENVKGDLAFDVPSPHMLIVYSPGVSSALGGWQF